MAPDPEACRWEWERNPLGVALLPAGRRWDVLILPGSSAIPPSTCSPAPRPARARCSPTSATPAWASSCPPGTASRWLGTGVRGAGAGTWIVVPYPGRATGGVRWLIPPDGAGTLTDPALLELAMHEAAAAVAWRDPAEVREAPEVLTTGLVWTMLGALPPSIPPCPEAVVDRTRPPSTLRTSPPVRPPPSPSAGLVAAAPAAAAADADLARNGGFEAGLDGWSCSGRQRSRRHHTRARRQFRAQGHPGRAGQRPCSQTVTVKPNSTYTLSAWVQGSYVYLGATGTGTTDVSTWTQSAGALEAAHHHLPHRPVHHLGDGLHPRLVRHRPPTTPTTSPSSAPAATRRSSPRPPPPA